MTRAPAHHFARRTACLLHRSDEVRGRLGERLGRLGIALAPAADRLAAGGAAVDLVILDLDSGYDGQLPWVAGPAPVPVIGLVGSESPGRLAWALQRELDAFLPVSALDHIFSTLVIAFETFDRKVERRAREAEMGRRANGRLDVIRAVLRLMEAGVDEAVALKQLRAFAMVERLSLEDAAARLLARPALRTGRP